MIERCRLACIGLPLLLLSGAALARADSVSEVFKRVRASVVVIETEQKEPDPMMPGAVVSVGGLGSGVLISSDGLVLTAAHVVQTAEAIRVKFLSGETIRARDRTSEPAADVALLQLSRRPGVAQVAPVGDSDRVEVGEQIFIVGAPMGIEHTLTVGYVSARRQKDSLFGSLYPTELLQTDAAINQGNSGGPMFNLRGEVVGVVSHIISHSGGSEGLGFVITSNMAKRLLLEQRSMWSGVQGRTLDGELARALNVPQSRGMLIERVASRSPAAHVGLRGGTIPVSILDEEMVLGGDIILEVQGISVAEDRARERIRADLSRLEDGDEIVVKVLRGGEIVTLKNYFFPKQLVPSAPEE